MIFYDINIHKLLYLYKLYTIICYWMLDIFNLMNNISILINSIIILRYIVYYIKIFVYK